MTTGSYDDDSDRDRSEEPRGSRDGDELDAAEVDERFAALVAGLDDAPRWPDDEADDDTDTRTSLDTSADTAPPSARTTEPEDEEPSLLELWDTELPPDAEEEEEDYEPPPPPPLPIPSLPAVLGVVMVLGGITLIVWPEALSVGSNLGLGTGVLSFVGGVLTLIWRLRPEPEDGESDDGNGAVV